jgi:hypothetical protein
VGLSHLAAGNAIRDGLLSVLASFFACFSVQLFFCGFLIFVFLFLYYVSLLIEKYDHFKILKFF